MTALDQLRSLIDRELGTSGWSLASVENLDCASPDGGVLRTQRGFIPFSTLKILVELIPRLWEDWQDAEYSEDEIQQAYDEGWRECRMEHDYD